MEALLASGIGLITAAGIYLLLRARTFPVVLGLTLISYAVNLTLFASGGLELDSAPIVNGAETYTDPLPQALVLTAIVIGFAMTAFVLVLAVRSFQETGTDHVDGGMRGSGRGQSEGKAP